MKIYLAGPWVRREDVRRVAARLQAEGYELTSRWLYEHEGDPNDASGLGSPEAYIRLQATEDLIDVMKADVFVMLNLEKSEGKAVELGFAIANQKRVFCVGKRFNIFCSLGTQLDTVDELLFALSGFTTPA